MSRTIYESQGDLSNENFVKKVIEDKNKGVVLHKLPMSYRMDFIAFNKGKPSSVIEVKTRNRASHTYDYFKLALSKWNAGIDYVNKNGVAFILAGKFTDGVYCYHYKPTDKVKIQWFNGRKDRDDPDDKEPLVNVPMELFKKI